MNRKIAISLSATLLCAASLTLAQAPNTTKTAGMSKPAPTASGTAKLTDTIASVNGKPVTWKMLFDKVKADAKTAPPSPMGVAPDVIAQSVGQVVGDKVSKGVFGAGTTVTVSQSDVLNALKKDTPPQLNSTLQTMLRDMALNQEAAKVGLKVDNAFMNAYVTRLLKQARLRSPEQFPNNMTDDQFLASRSIKRESLYQQLRWQATAMTLAQKEAEKQLGHPYSGADFVKARHILIAIKQPAPDAKAEEKLKAEQEALDKIKSISADIKANKKKFEDAAVEFSEDPSAKQNKGELGVFTHGQMVPEFEKAAFSMKANEISEPIKTQFGYHLIQVEASGAELKPEEWQGAVDTAMQQKFQQYLQELMSGKAKIVNTLHAAPQPQMGGMMPGGGGGRPMPRPNQPRN